MGLDTSHDCWHGSYHSFHNWRARITEISGYGDLDQYRGFGGQKPWPDTDDVLLILLNHSDCEGEIEAAVCTPLAARLEALLPGLEAPADEYYAQWTRRFIEGLRLAATRGESVDFH